MSGAKLKSLYLDNVGQTIRIKSFVSTSTDMDVAEQFISHDGVRKSHKRIILHIYSKNGREIFDISEFNGIFADKNQHGCLFDKGTVFYVSPDIEEVNGVIHIKLNEV